MKDKSTKYNLLPMLWKHFFHLKILCVQKHNKMTIENDIMVTDTFTLLTPKHFSFLCQKGLLEIIVAKLKGLQIPSV